VIGGSEIANVSVIDTATVTGSAGTPGGTLTYYFYNTATPVFGTTTPVSTQQVTLSGGIVPNSLPSDPLTAGGFSYIASYSGDSNYNPFIGSVEPFTVTVAAPFFNTYPGSGAVLGSGNKLTDSALLSSGFTPGGTITFYLFAPGVTANVMLSNNVYSDVVTVNGNGMYTTGMGSNPGGYLPTAAGTYHWVVDYSGDTHNTPGSSAFGSESETATLPPQTAGVFRSSGQWFLDQANVGYSAATTRQFNFGNSTDIPVSGDWDGDGLKDVGVFRPSTGQWFLDVGNKDYSNNPVAGINFGGPGDVPIVGHWLGGSTDYIGVWRPSTGTFYLSLNNQSWDGSTVSDSTLLVFQLGTAGDKPVVGDWQGIGVDHVGVWRPGGGAQWFLDVDNTSYISNSSPNLIYISNYGTFGDIPVVGKWLADGIDRPGVFRPVDTDLPLVPQSHWYLNLTDQAWNPSNVNAANEIIFWGASGDIPVVGDWNGTGISQVGVFRPSDSSFGGQAGWYLDVDNVGAWTGFTLLAPFQFGGSSDRPASGLWQLAGLPQLLAGAPGAGTASLSLEQLQAVAAEALGNWQAAGLSASQLALLQGAQFEVTNLPSGWLGESLGNVVLIDATADGYGWFMDPTASPSANQVDLLTVVMHEMGHALGLPDITTPGSTDLMAQALAAGIRRLPSLADVDAAFAS
jgi:hypothetical protein